MFEFPAEQVSFRLSSCTCAYTTYGMPVPATAHDHHLRLHGVDVLQGPLLRVDAALNGSILGRQAKRIPADGVEDVVALHALEAGEDIRDGVDAQMAEVQRARGVREHGQDVGLAPGRRGLAVGRGQLVPVRLPFGREGLDVGRGGCTGAGLEADRPGGCAAGAGQTNLGRRRPPDGATGAEASHQPQAWAGSCRQAVSYHPRLPRSISGARTQRRRALAGSQQTADNRQQVGRRMLDSPIHTAGLLDPAGLLVRGHASTATVIGSQLEPLQ